MTDREKLQEELKEPVARISKESIESSKHSKGRATALIILIASFVLLVSSLVYAYSVYRDNHDQAVAGTDLAKEVVKACNSKYPPADLVSICNQAGKVVKSGEENNIISQGPAGAKGETGPQGPAGPPVSNSQVQRAVSKYCQGGRCNGKSVTTVEVAKAVAKYCNSHGKCQGPVGPKGDRGDSGINGTNGTNGSTPSDSQLAQAVSSYCGAHNNCKGDSGSDATSDGGATNISTVGCDGPLPVTDITASYDPDTRTITLTCS